MIVYGYYHATEDEDDDAHNDYVIIKGNLIINIIQTKEK